ncbi:MAG: heavy metal transporter [Carbonactinosporaceae bacterium]
MRFTGRGWSLLIVAACLVLIVLVGLAVVRLVTGYLSPEVCAVQTPAGEITLTPEQASNATTIAAVAVRRGLPERAVTIALAAAMQESKLRNLPAGDRDSIGLFQQRPSQGWGTPDEILDPAYAAERFYDALIEVSGYAELPLTVAAQRVQRSAAPTAYAQHEGDAIALSAALTGRRKSALTCTYQLGFHPAETMRPQGLTPRAAAVGRLLERDFGALSIGGFAPGGIKSGHVEGSAHYDGRALDVFFRPPSSAQQERGWALAHWTVAHAEALGVEAVIYDGRIWTVGRSSSGWREYVHPSGRTDDPVLMHRDHVHVEVVEGT